MTRDYFPQPRRAATRPPEDAPTMVEYIEQLINRSQTEETET